LGLLSPDGRQAMLEHAGQFAAAGTPFIFDPGQGLPMFNGEELLDFIDKAEWACMNDYESKLTQERTGLSIEALAKKVKAFIVTRGGEGSWIYTDGRRIEIPPARAAEINDPTGCGDAYRGGLLYGMMQGMDWETTGRIAALMGAIKIERHGTQNHRFGLEEFKARYQESFGSSLD
jgi:adenosine kinase